MTPEVIGANISRLRAAAGLTQVELGQNVNVTQVTISGWEKGRRSPSACMLSKLATTFGVSIDELLGTQAA